MFGDYDGETKRVSIPLTDNASLELVVFGAALLIVLNVLYVIYRRRPKEPLRFVPSAGPGGPVRIAREALESGLRAAGERLDVVTRLRVTVEHGGVKRILVRAFFQSPDGVAILDASRDLRQALTDRFHEMVRVQDGVRAEFEIEFVGFSGKLAKKPEPAAPPEEPSPFTGPKYPLPEDDPFDGREGR